MDTTPNALPPESPDGGAARAKKVWHWTEVALLVQRTNQGDAPEKVAAALDRSARSVTRHIQRLRAGRIPYPPECPIKLDPILPRQPRRRSGGDERTLAQYEALGQRLDQAEADLARCVGMLVALLAIVPEARVAELVAVLDPETCLIVHKARGLLFPTGTAHAQPEGA